MGTLVRCGSGKVLLVILCTDVVIIIIAFMGTLVRCGSGKVLVVILCTDVVMHHY